MTSFIKRHQVFITAATIFCVMTACFYFIKPAADWETFWGAGRLVLHGQPLYDKPITWSYFFYPPWTAVPLAFFALFPQQLGYALFSALTVTALFLLARKWNIPAAKLPAILLSPPVFYCLNEGQIDILAICLMLLPADWWLLAAMIKPQAAIGLAGTLFTQKRWQMLIAPAAVLALSFVFFGFWPAQVLSLPNQLASQGHNLWHGFWPLTIPVGVGLFAAGLRKKDDQLLLSSSPFFSPYCPGSTLTGFWLMLVAKLETWMLYLVLVTWWGALVLWHYL